MRDTDPKSIESFFSQKSFALVGASPTGRRFGNSVGKSLKQKGMDIVYLHSQAAEINGQASYASLSALPKPADALIVSTQPENAMRAIEEAKTQGIKHIWLQPGSESDAAIKACKDQAINLIHGECILMFAEPVGFPHNAHRCLCKWFGKYPRAK